MRLFARVARWEILGVLAALVSPEWTWCIPTSAGEMIADVSLSDYDELKSKAAESVVSGRGQFQLLHLLLIATSHVLSAS
jgi:hypothetical protein